MQDLVHDHPSIIPMAEIEPAFMPLISICRELPTTAGYLDNLWLTPAGGIVLGECKLVRNPQARREVVAQALDYARAISGWHFNDLERAVQQATKSPKATLWNLVREHTDLDEAQFVDAVERRLRTGRFMVLIIGDGIQEGVEALTSFLQLYAGLHTGIALIDLSIWRDVEGRLLVIPRIPLRTILVERGIVTVEPSTAAKILPPKHMEPSRTSSETRAVTASEPEFYDQLDQRRPGVSSSLRAFLERLTSVGVMPEFRRTLILRWQPSPDVSASAGLIDTSGKVWFGDAWSTANRLGHPRAGERYLQSLADLVGGSIKRYEKSPPHVVNEAGTAVDVQALLDQPDEWIAAIAELISTTHSSDEV